jgi:hypothetical protein
MTRRSTTRKNRSGNCWLLVAVALVLLVPASAQATVTACPSATTLEQLVTCLKDSNHLPRSSSQDYVIPNLTEQLDWATVASDMLDATLTASCAGISLPGSLASFYEVTTFVDSENGTSYCVLAEVALTGAGNKKAWGTFMTNLDAARELAIAIPHPLNDLDTPEQGIGVFKANRARSYMLSGAHRNANNQDGSSCQSSYFESDPAHDNRHMFQPASEALLSWYQTQLMEDQLVMVQFHGMGTSNCSGVDAYLTYGLAPGAGTPSPGDDILTLQAEMESRHPSWVLVVPGGTPSCTLNATTNVNGRYLNGVSASSTCGTNATSYSGRFIHIEQKRDFRLPADWVDAIDATWPAGSGSGCNVDADCDDGAFCNGVETCNAGSCLSGTAPNCDDGVSCTDDACNEGSDSCASTANDANCDNGLFCDGSETCDPVLDCQASSGDPCLAGETCDEANDYCIGDCAPLGASCTVAADCCTNKCKGKAGNKTCK